MLKNADLTNKDKKQAVPKWFKFDVYDEGGTVQNTISGATHYLNPLELSIYDYTMGLNTVMWSGKPHSKKIITDFHKCINWFRKNNIEAYYTLLD